MSKQETRVLTIEQPWAWAIMEGFKDVENRDWILKYQGILAIHSSKTFDKEGYEWISKNCSMLGINPFEIPQPEDFSLGYILGTIFMEGVIELDQEDVEIENERLLKYLSSEWFFGKYGFCLQHPRKCKQISLKGQLGVFRLPDDIKLEYIE